MKRYTPKDLAKELKINNKQEMRNMLRDFKELLDPQPSNHGFFRFQNGKDINCGPYMTYDDDDLVTLRKVCLFKQLGVKRSKIIRLMEEEDEEAVIDKLISMLEKKENEIKEQVIMAKQMKVWGMNSGYSQIMLEGKTAHEFVELLKDDYNDYDSGMINMCLSAMTCEMDEIIRELRKADCLDYPAVKDFLAGNTLSAKIQEMGRFDAKIFKKLGKLLRLLLKDDVTGDLDLIDKYVKSIVKDVNEGYGFIGKVSFGLLWYLVCLSHNEEDFMKIDQSFFEHLTRSPQDELLGDIRIMFEQAEWEDDLFDRIFDILENEDELVVMQEWLPKLCDFACEGLNIRTETETVYFIHLLKRIWKYMARTFEKDIVFKDDLDELEKLTEKFTDIIIPEFQKLMQDAQKR